jgi:Fe2+ transport system protein FeoA
MSRNEAELCTLTDLDEGRRGIIVRAVGGYGLVRRLAEMGLTPGTEVKLLKKGPFGGPVEVEVRGVALALGRGVASKVLVKPVKE